jgi:hypothetical protein
MILPWLSMYEGSGRSVYDQGYRISGYVIAMDVVGWENWRSAI